MILAARAQGWEAGTALVQRVPTLNGTVEGSIQQMSAESITLNGGARLTGDLLLPGTPTLRLNGNPTYSGTLDGAGASTPTTHRLTLNGNATLGRLVRRTDAVALPTVSSPLAPTGTRNVSLNNAAGTPGDFATLKNLTLNGNAGAITVPPGSYGDFTANGSNRFVLGVAGATVPAVYHFQKLTLNGSSRLDLAGPVIVTLAGSLTANGSLGTAMHPAWLTLHLATGSLTLNGNVTLHGYVTAPAGTVTINGNTQLIGGLIADRLTVNGNGLLRLLAATPPNQPPTVALTAPANGTTLTLPVSLTLTATASDPDGTIATVEFYSGATKLGEATTTSTPNTFTLPFLFPQAGAYSLTARATDNAGATTTSAAVTLMVNPASAVVPVITPAGTDFVRSTAAPGSLSFQITATGPITLVELYRGATNVADTTTPTAANIFTLPLPSSAPGTFIYTARAYTANASAVSAAVTLTLLPPLPYLTDFESGAGYTLGSLQGQRGWLVERGTAQIIAPDASAGTQSAHLDPSAPPALLSQDFFPITSEPVQFFDFFARPVAAAAPTATFTVEGAQFGFLLSAGQGRLQVFRPDQAGGGAWTPTPFTAPLTTSQRTTHWVRLTARLDFARQTWDLYGDARLVAADAPLPPPARTALTFFEFLGDTTAATGLDDLLVGPDNPIFADVNRNGLDDAWELVHGLSLSNYNRDLMPADNGVTVLQAYLAGTDPQDYYQGAAPQLTLVSGDAQNAPTGQFNAAPFVVRIRNAAGAPLANAPVSFTVTTGGGQLAASPTHPTLASTLTLRTDAAGEVQAAYQQPATPGTVSTITVRAGVAQATLTSMTPAAVVLDADGNGLPDTWEQQYFGGTGTNPAADLDGDGRTHLEEFQAGTDPTDYYNGALPQLTAQQAAGALGPGGSLAMRVTNPAGAPLANAPVIFRATVGGHRLSVTPTSEPFNVVEVRTDAQGLARAYVREAN